MKLSPLSSRPISLAFHALGALAIVLALVGCAQLPIDVARPVSTALAPAADSPLVELMQKRRQAASARADSGFLLLGTPQSA